MIFMLLFNECSLLLHFEQLAVGPKNTHKFQSRRNELYFGGPNIEKKYDCIQLLFIVGPNLGSPMGSMDPRVLRSWL